MAVEPGERVLVVTDETRRNIAGALEFAARSVTDRVETVEIPVATVNGQEPPPETAEKALATREMIKIRMCSVMVAVAQRVAAFCHNRLIPRKIDMYCYTHFIKYTRNNRCEGFCYCWPYCRHWFH